MIKIPQNGLVNFLFLKRANGINKTKITTILTLLFNKLKIRNIYANIIVLSFKTKPVHT